MDRRRATSPTTPFSASAVGLVDRADVPGLVTCTRSDEDHRVVRLCLTTAGAERLETLSAVHLEEVRRLAAQPPGTWDDVDPTPRAQL
ncbi:MAG: hypothetical protein ACYCTE_02515 [Acidimicrobiales bacterium]